MDDAHEFLRKHFREYDFIWASPPCPTHSRLQLTNMYKETLKYPDMTLYQEIIWLKTFFKGKWVIENVKPYYEPLIPPTFIMDRHYFWSSNFVMGSPQDDIIYTSIRDNISSMEKVYGFDLSKYNRIVDKRKVLRNCVKPQVGKYILDKILE